MHCHTRAFVSEGRDAYSGVAMSSRRATVREDDATLDDEDIGTASEEDAATGALYIYSRPALLSSRDVHM